LEVSLRDARGYGLVLARWNSVLELVTYQSEGLAGSKAAVKLAKDGRE